MQTLRARAVQMALVGGVGRLAPRFVMCDFRTFRDYVASSTDFFEFLLTMRAQLRKSRRPPRERKELESPVMGFRTDRFGLGLC